MIKKTMLLSMATLVVAVAFSQVNLGVKSTTDATLKTAAKASAVSKTVSSTGSSAKGTVSTSENTVKESKTKVSQTVKEKKDQAVTNVKDRKENVKNNADVKTDVSAEVQGNATSSTSSGNDQNVNSGSSGIVSGSSEVKAEVDGKPVIEKAEASSEKVVAYTQKETEATIKKTHKAKAKGQAKTKHGVKATKKAVKENKPNAQASSDVEVKSATEVKTSNQ